MNKSLFIALFTAALLWTSPFAIAKEPTNLDTCKQEVIRYYQSHQYDEDVSKVTANAMRYLKLRLDQPYHDDKKPAIILDIDETSLSNYPHMVKLNFGGSLAEIRKIETEGNDPAIKSTLKLFRFAKAHHIAVIFLTGREDNERDSTIKNLQTAGYNNWDGLYFRTALDKTKTAASYKTAFRKKLSAEYDILLNMGDQVSDLAGGYADKAFKLPNPFYYIA